MSASAAVVAACVRRLVPDAPTVAPLRERLTSPQGGILRTMTDIINHLAAEAAAASPGGVLYTYAAQDALAARILVVEEGGLAFPRGSNIGSPEDDITGK